MASESQTDLLAPTISAKLQVSGIYPHLAVFNQYGECGIGATAPWAGKLWLITYPPHEPHGSSDKLYEIAPDLSITARAESVGGTHACRMIHRESNQLIIGPYFIDAKGNVRACDLKKLAGRMTAVARHLVDPANKVYFIDMEGAIYEVDVHSLAVTRIFDKPAPGWHGKGGYTAQGRLVITNNGEMAAGKAPTQYLATPAATSPEDAGVLAEWDGKTWRIVRRRQFTDVTGPGGIYGSPDDQSPLWAVGWDRRSVILELLDQGKWSTFRLPKASHAFDPSHGWYTEWPRIREATTGRWMMDMHGMFYDFPVGFSIGRTAGIRPIASHLRYVPDFCHWDGRLILASDETSIMQNPMAGVSQSNLWFGNLADLSTFGPRTGWGGVWLQDPVKAGTPSDPLLIAGFANRIVHLAHSADTHVSFTLEIDPAGDGHWQRCQTVDVPPRGSRFYIFPGTIDAPWCRLVADRDCTATAYFHLTSLRETTGDASFPLNALAKASDAASISAGLIRPAGHNRNLQFVAQTIDASGRLQPSQYYELDETLQFLRPQDDRSDEVRKIAAITKDFEIDVASVILMRKDKNTGATTLYRLPKGDACFDKPFAAGWPRGLRECESERYLRNVHGTIYEQPRDDGVPLIKPICSHNRQIMDFCTWRGLLVLSGNRLASLPDGHYFHAGPGLPGLWFGMIDDLWRLGKPVGKGGPWFDTPVEANAWSDPYLMTGYDRKRVELSHDSADTVSMTVEIDVDHRQWLGYQTFTVPAGQTLSHTFPAGFSAHWVRIRAKKPCKATAVFTYE
jgi:hypothetical protein